jgi:hypothetical protein
MPRRYGFGFKLDESLVAAIDARGHGGFAGRLPVAPTSLGTEGVVTILVLGWSLHEPLVAVVLGRARSGERGAATGGAEGRGDSCCRRVATGVRRDGVGAVILRSVWERRMRVLVVLIRAVASRLV